MIWRRLAPFTQRSACQLRSGAHDGHKKSRANIAPPTERELPSARQRFAACVNATPKSSARRPVPVRIRVFHEEFLRNHAVNPESLIDDLRHAEVHRDAG